MTKSDDAIKRLRCVFVWNYLTWGGAQMYMLSIARHLLDRMDVEFWMPTGSSSKFLSMCTEAGVTVRFLDRHVDTAPAASLAEKLSRHAKKLLSEFEIAKRSWNGNIDVIHADFGPWMSISLLLLLSFNANTFYTVHNRLPGVGPLRALLWRVKFLLARATGRLHAFAANKDAKESLLPYAGRDYVSDTVVTYACINPAEITEVTEASATAARQHNALRLEEGDRLIVTVGQFIDRKGRWVLLDAASEILRSFPNARFLWVTDTEVDPDDERRFATTVDGGRFILLQMSKSGISRRELLEIVAGAEVFVLPSLVEGLPIAMLEAMALGTPVVASRINGIPEAISDGVNGLLVRAGDGEQLALAVKRLLSDRGLRAAISKNAALILESEFTEEAVADLAFEHYASATNV